MGGMGSDDPFLAVVRYFPILFVIGGVLVVIWLSGQRLPHELQPDVLEALSETEALPPSTIAQREPLAHQDVDLRLLETVLDGLCNTGQAVRWFEVVDRPGSAADSHRQVVYRRISRSSL
jgi:hypothetical protein